MAADTSREIRAAKFEAFLNGAYQADREAHLDRWHRNFMFAVILLGASSVADVLPEELMKWAQLATAAIGALDLVLNLSVRARTAAFLRKAYFEVAAELEEGSLTLEKAKANLLRLAGEEEPPYKAAHALAENWAAGAVYGTDEPVRCRVSWRHKLTRHYIHYASRDFSIPST